MFKYIRLIDYAVIFYSDILSTCDQTDQLLLKRNNIVKNILRLVGIIIASVIGISFCISLALCVISSIPIYIASLSCEKYGKIQGIETKYYILNGCYAGTSRVYFYAP